MKKLYFLILICFTCLNGLFSQTAVRNYKGRVLDSASFKPLADASVCIYRASDTSLLNFGFTTPNGNFSLGTKSSDSLIIIVSVFGYNEHVMTRSAEDGWDFHDFGDIKLSVMPLNLRGVTVKSSAIRMKGDTIEINASRFKVLPGSDVAQLFKKIPGFEVSVKGEIKVNGSSVTKIMVDGSDFFGNNPGMVSKNLTADMIETVQVYEDLNEDGSPKEQSSKVINLKLKKGKKNGTFGDLMAGYGNNQRYESGIRLNNFKNDRKFSFILNGNNTNETGFDFGFDNWHSSYSAERNGSASDEGLFYYTYNNNNGEGNINNKLSSGFTYFNEFSRKRKISLNVFGNRNQHNSIEASRNYNAINDSTQRSNTDSSVTNGLALAGTFELNYTKTIDSTGGYDFGITSSLANNKSNTEANNIIRLNEMILNRGLSAVRNTSDNKKTEFHANIRRYARKNVLRMFSLNSSFSLSDNNNLSYQFLENSIDTFNNLNERNTKSNELLLKAFGRTPIYKKFLFNISADRWQQNNQSVQLSRSAQNRFSNQFEQTYLTKIDTLSIALDNRMEQYTVKPFLSFSRKYLYLSGGVTFMQLNIRNKFHDSADEISTNYAKSLPFFNLSYYPGQMYIYFSASKSTSFPTISELLPILNISNNYERRSGNKNLSPEDNYGIRTFVNFYKLKGFRYFYFNISASMSDNAKIWVNRQNADGIIIKSPENAKGKKEFSTWFSISKKMSKVFNLELSVNQSSNTNPLIINEKRAFGTSNSLSLSPGFNFTKADSLDLSLGMTYNYNDYRNSLNDVLNFKQNTYSYFIRVRALFKTGTELNSSLDISDQRNVPSIGKIVPVWNAYLQQPLDKNGKYNLKLTAYDILKRNTNITRYASDNFIYVNQSNRLQQYFMLTLIYKIKKVGAAEDELNYVY